MKVKKLCRMLIVISLCMSVLCGCSMQSRELGWIPEQSASGKSGKNNSTKEQSQGKNSGSEVHSVEEIVEAAMRDDRSVADLLWENRYWSQQYLDLGQEIASGNILTYYISSSEGDDNNDGLSPKKPKKSLENFSGLSNINISLKCGDTFAMNKEFSPGSNVVVSTYDEGPRPVLTFYKDLECEWKPVIGYDKVWQADISGIAELQNANADFTSCNIGHLLMNGEAQWKRLNRETGQDLEYVTYLEETADGSWAVEESEGILYLYSETDPSEAQIQYAMPCFGMMLYNVHDVVIKGLELKGAGFHGISVSGIKNVTISDCYIHHIGGALLKNTNTRYGNAIELWDSGEGFLVENNIADWIFDTCYTNQGSNKDAVQKGVTFRNNIGRNAFWVIETWGDGYAATPFENILYEGNLCMNACDVTAPDTSYFVNDKGNVLTKDTLVTYRSGAYPYHQMSLLNASRNKQQEQLQIRNNLFCGTDRFVLMLQSIMDIEDISYIQNNIFVAELLSGKECVFRYAERLGWIHYVPEIPIENNVTHLFRQGDEYQLDNIVLQWWRENGNE